MIKCCVVCNKDFNFSSWRWNKQVIKIPVCSKICKKDNLYKNLCNAFLIESRGYPMGYHNLEEYQEYLILLNTKLQCICGTEFSPKYNGQEYCSKQCTYSSKKRSEKISKTWKTSVNVEEVLQKRKKTSLEKYGVENPNQNIDVQNKIKETCIKKYGVDNPFKDKKRVAEGVRKKYGVDSYFQRTDLLKQDYLKKFGVDNPQKDPKIKKKTLKTVQEKYGELLGAVPEKQTKKTCMERYGHEYFFGSDVGNMSFENLKKNYEWTDQEIDELRKQKRANSVNLGRASRQSLTYFIPLYKKLRKIGIQRNQIFFGAGKNIEYNINGYYYDFCIPELKIIIEFHGESFHPNKEKLNEIDWKMWWQVYTERTAEEQYRRDQLKKNLALINNFNFIELWASTSILDNWDIINKAFLEKGIIL